MYDSYNNMNKYINILKLFALNTFMNVLDDDSSCSGR